MYQVWGGFLIGMFGSLHCIGMCSPIAFSLNYPQDRFGRLQGMLLYNLGRTVTYAAFGALVGLAGRGIFYSGAQQYFSIIAGLIIVIAFAIRLTNYRYIVENFRPFSSIYNRLSALISRGGLWNNFTVGVLNGFLPCGLVFLAAASALVQPTIEYSILYMALFGLGTTPVMLGAMLLQSGTVKKYKLNFQRVLPYIGIIIGTLMILRGLELDIAYLSPRIEHTLPGEVATDCQ